MGFEKKVSDGQKWGSSKEKRRFLKTYGGA